MTTSEVISAIEQGTKRIRELNGLLGKANAEVARLHAEVERLTLYVSKAILTVEGTMLCSPQVGVKYNEAIARAERAEAELHRLKSSPFSPRNSADPVIP